MRLFRWLPVAILTVTLTSCDSSGSDAPDVSGTWTGTALLPNAFNTRADFNQNGNDIGGTMRVNAAFPESPVVGEISDTGRLTWAVNNECERWSGTLTLSGGELSGTIALDDTGCPDPVNVSGTLTLRR